VASFQLTKLQNTIISYRILVIVDVSVDIHSLGTAKMAPPSQTLWEKLLANSNRSVQRYFNSIESRVGYRLVLGGTRHFGYYLVGTYWPFPISKALRAMEDQLLISLGLGTGSAVLDAGCGVGHVAIHLARSGLRIQCIDIVDHHIQKAQRNVKAQGFQDVISVRKMDYHRLEGFVDESFDGVYTMETLVHAVEPGVALREFFRVLKPGGSISLNEYEYKNRDNTPTDVWDTKKLINKYASMPAADGFHEGSIQELLEETGFQDVVVKDFSANIVPMLRLFYFLSYIPYLLIKLLGLQGQFVNTTAGFEGYRGRQYWRYVAISAKKPEKISIVRHATGVEQA